MAEPLLRRTFSKLTGRDRRHRKSKNKMNEVFLSDVQSSSSPSSSSLTSPTATVTNAPPRSHHSDGARKQQWVEHSSVTPPSSFSQHMTASDKNQDWCSPVWGSAPSPAQQGSCSGRRSYLQSLERSSRAWVLSGREEGAPQGNIWYNPIPEDEEDRAAPTQRPRPHTAESSPASGKKEGVSSSAIDRRKSPGTKRRLSLKMKNLPELRRKLSLRSTSRPRHDESPSLPGDHTVVSRYHLDSSASCTRPPLRRFSKRSSAAQGGYLSDGDSPEPSPRLPSCQPAECQESICDVTMFPLYMAVHPVRSSQRLTGLLTVHLLGLEDMQTSRSEVSKDVFVIVQIDGVTRARTAVLHLLGSALSLNHTFHLQLEHSQQLRIVVLTPGGGAAEPNSSSSRNRVCGLGNVSIAGLFKGSRSQQLCLKLEPRGLLYVKLSLQERWDPQLNSGSPSSVFGVDLHHLVEKEGSAHPIPLLIQKTVHEIERRGLKVVGLYRLCGSAAVKKELREWFERSSSAVCLSEDLYPDINVITGVLKDYLRELPSPLITSTLYSVVRQAMDLPASLDGEQVQRAQELLSCLPSPEKATLSLLLDHLSLVASFSSFNRMTHQNLSVVFGPVLLTATMEVWKAKEGPKKGGVKGHGEDPTSTVNFKQHIEALHFLLQLWPVPTQRFPSGDDSSYPAPPTLATNPPSLPPPSAQRTVEDAVVSRRERGTPSRLDSPPPINRYAGDWSVCGRDPLSDKDYDEVESKSSEEEEEAWPAGGGLLDLEAPFNCRLSLKDFDMLIRDLDRELANQIHICL